MLLRFILNTIRIPQEFIENVNPKKSAFYKAGLAVSTVLALLTALIGLVLSSLSVYIAPTSSIVGFILLAIAVIVSLIIAAYEEKRVNNTMWSGSNPDLKGEGGIIAGLIDLIVDVVDNLLIAIPTIFITGSFAQTILALAIVQIFVPKLKCAGMVYGLLKAVNIEDATVSKGLISTQTNSSQRDDSVEQYDPNADTYTYAPQLDVTDALLRTAVASILQDMRAAIILESGSVIQVSDKTDVSDYLSVKYKDGVIRRFFNPEPTSFVVVFADGTESGHCIDTDLNVVATVSRDDFQKQATLIFPSTTTADIIDRKCFFHDGVFYRNY